MKTLNELIDELIELQNQGKGLYTVIDGRGALEELAVTVDEDFNEIVFG